MNHHTTWQPSDQLNAAYIQQLEARVDQLAQELDQTQAQLARERQDRCQAEVSLRASQRQLHQVLDSVEAGIAWVDASRCYQFVNRFYEHRFNRSRSSMIGRSVWDVIGQEAYENVKPYIDLVLAGEPQNFEFKITYRDGQSAYIKTCLTPAWEPDNRVVGYYLFVFDITERIHLEQSLKAANTSLAALVTLDSLTQIANRRKFDDDLAHTWQEAARHQRPLALILFDLDFFKNYNDSYGHQAGDRCLQQVAQAVAATLHRPTDQVARYGGEEFAVILSNTDAAGAGVIAERIQQAVRALAIPHQGSRVSSIVSISLGIAATLPTTARSAPQLVASADQALYTAKQQGRDRSCLAPGSE